MAFEADCGSSTVLEAFRVASTVGFFVPGECQAPVRSCRSPQSARRCCGGPRREGREAS